MSQIRVLKPGLLTTLQDLGRYGYAHVGVSAGGAADALSLRVANLLVGNPEGEAVLEMTLLGAMLEFESDAVVAVTGAQAQCIVRTEVGNELAPGWEPFQMRAGERLECGAAVTGARMYLAVAGGIDVPRVLGSASTSVAAKIGGVGGRALRAGDVLDVGQSRGAVRGLREGALDDLFGREIRVTRGPQWEWFGEEGLARLEKAEYVVAESSNRNGIRLRGDAVLAKGDRQLLTEGVSLGAVQVPADGQPIILFVDQQTTGGYPKIANVIAADIHRVGQVKPQDTIRFLEISIDEAVEAFRARERWLAEAFA